jgi:transcriptional regulator with XRE-family HTH domain
VEIAEKIHNLMAERGITKYKLAKGSNVPYTTLTKILDGTTKNPQIDSLKQIADYLGKPLNYFTDDETQQLAPDWATARDKRDIKKILEEDLPVMFDGKPVSDEDRQRIKDLLTGYLWEAKAMNKKTYGRKKKLEKPDSQDSEE